MKRAGLIAGVVLAATALASVAFARSHASLAAPVKISIPAAGHFALKTFVLKDARTPIARITGNVAKDVSVLVTAYKDPKHKGQFVAEVLVLHRKARAAAHVDPNQPTGVFIGFDIPSSPLSLPTFCGQADAAADTLALIRQLHPDWSPQQIQDLLWSAATLACNRGEGNFGSLGAATNFLNPFLGINSVPGPGPAPAPDFTIFVPNPILGVGPNSSNGCWPGITVTETGENIPPSGSFEVTGPGGFDRKLPLIFPSAPAQPGIFIAQPPVVLFNSFATYNANATITVAGVTKTATGTLVLDSSEQNNAGCPKP